MERENRRQGRAQAETAQRRRRDDTTAVQAQRLPIPPETQKWLEENNRIPRWANDEGNRIYRLTQQDDYDPVADVPPVPVGTDAAGKPIMAHLLSKPRGFFDEDQGKAEARRKEVENAMVRGRVPGENGVQAGPGQGVGGAEIYVDKATDIGRGNQIIE